MVITFLRLYRLTKEGWMLWIQGEPVAICGSYKNIEPAKVSTLLSGRLAMESFWLGRASSSIQGKGDQPALSGTPTPLVAYRLRVVPLFETVEDLRELVR
ncbi:hypothetical protein IFM89_031391 [Coptis chinensis]|uniref:Uncharacterized protein n=1 Tax=Coptis chinensis TaxID=261450 RepID=A0A835HKV6_9MAGN|nr:hypothetical protein IFM89_031391 [Coptis chinensis]